ncbi:uncharacterized protein GGS22DRAFT_195761 [Annulohypoxylon maeteangense]|uniref:uncharacterized protein n=1 Tax=Annulohypoxylon maeteangense TaxID=1927788 RepID=UPI00200871EA|nr:uncharacterized protein GGS22DRAFT_195761 [Annulohypoxylon maeteangense]KAI0882480.1 hypothetical protein GGS22DRAFT_195761 [Annulohypoxylon maeteangense]
MEQVIQVFKSQSILVLEPGQAEYRHAIATSNLLYRFSKPDCVVQPKNAIQVRTIINEAKSKSMKVTIKCNGHYAGYSRAFGDISLDLRGMNNVELDMKSMTVTIDAGCQWDDVYKKLVTGGHDGVIINGGRCPTAGVSGFILGGSPGPFTRSFGMGSDNLMEATIVTAEGELVTVGEGDDSNSDKGRLFWAIRGAGGGNFGVVVQMKLRVQKLSNRDGMVVAGRYQWFPPGGFNVEDITTMNEIYTAQWPNNLTIDTTWICDLRQNKPVGVRFIVSFDGSKDEYDKEIEKNIPNSKLKNQFKQRVLAEKSTRFLYETLGAQWMEDTERGYPTNKIYKLYRSFIFKNDKEGIAKITAIIRDLTTTFQKDFKGENVNFLVTWIHSGGKAAEKNPSESAFFWRKAVFHTYVTVEWVDKWMERDMRSFLENVKVELKPLSLNEKAGTIDCPDEDLSKDSHGEAYFGSNYYELRKVKQMWDPNSFFEWAQGIQCAGNPKEDTKDKTDQFASQHWERRREQRWTYYTED